MNKNILTNETPDVTAEACAWITQLETGELSAADIDAFREWMRRSPRHAAEIKRLASVSKDLNVLTEMSESLREAATRHQPIVKDKSRQSLFIARRIAPFAIAASVVLTISFFLLRPGLAPEGPVIMMTAMGEYQEVTLSDGTIVKLNTDSQIEVTFDDNKRNVRLLRGEVYFEVAHDSSWPFYVYAGEKVVRVVGTAFIVSLLEKDFAVTVTQGRVELAETTLLTGALKEQGTAEEEDRAGAVGAIGSVLITLEAGQSITISATRELTPVVILSERDLQRELSWQEGLHDFSSTTLDEVVKELSRYSPMQIEIADPTLRDLKFGGIFRTGETQPLFDALQTSFGIDVEYVDDNKVRLSLAAQE